MTAVYYDNSTGQLGSPLGSGAVTVDLGAVPDWGTLSGAEFIKLILEPPVGPVVSAGFEIAYVTAYTAGDSTATVVKGQEGTADVSHARYATWAVGVLASDLAPPAAAPLVLSGLLTLNSGQPVQMSGTGVLDGGALTGYCCANFSAGPLQVGASGLVIQFGSPFEWSGIPASGDGFDVTASLVVSDAAGANILTMSSTVYGIAEATTGSVDLTLATPTIVGADLSWNSGDNGVQSAAGGQYWVTVAAFGEWD